MVTDIFAVIADRTRRDILDTLRTGDKAVGELVEALDASQPTVSKHLKVLRDAGLVTTRAQGQKRYYALRLEPLDGVSEWLAGLAEAPVPSATDDGAQAERRSAPTAVVPPAAATARTAATTAHTAVPTTAAKPITPAAAEPAAPAAVEASRPAQLQRTVERAAARATELMSNLPTLPKFGRRK